MSTQFGSSTYQNGDHELQILQGQLWPDDILRAHLDGEELRRSSHRGYAVLLQGADLDQVATGDTVACWPHLGCHVATRDPYVVRIVELDRPRTLREGRGYIDEDRSASGFVETHQVAVTVRRARCEIVITPDPGWWPRRKAA